MTTCANVKPCPTDSAIPQSNSARKIIKFNVSDKGLSEAERSELLKLLMKNEDVFSTSLQDLGRTDLYQHTIEIDPHAPLVHLPFYRQAPYV